MTLHEHDQYESVRAMFHERWLAPAEKIEPHLGAPGYSLPSISGFAWHPIRGGAGNNWVVAPSDMIDWQKKIRFEFAPGSRDNVIVLGPKSSVIGRVLCHGTRNLAILLGATIGANLINVHFFSNDHVFFWGSGCTSNTTTFEFGSDGTSIIVGEDCMFSAGIDVRTHDEHGIVDMNSGLVLNVAGNVHFEPHVWVGLGASVLKGVRVGFCSVLATKAVVTRSIPARAMAAGVPARVIRENIGWVRERNPRPQAVNYLTSLATKYNIV